MTHASPEQNNVIHTIEDALNQSACVITPMFSQGVIEVTGEDAVTFLQGQLTNDIKQLDRHAQLNGYCSPKGRLLSILKTYRIGSAIYLECPVSQQDFVQKRLQMFVLRAKVKLNRVNEQWFRVGIAGNDIENTLAQLGLTLPKDVNEITVIENTVIIRLPGEIPRVQIWLATQDVEQQYARLQSICRPMTEDVWTGFEILAGIPTILPESQELFVPQMVNMDLLSGINFKKGCYTGQEIVARTHYLGKVKRRTLVFTLSNNTLENTPKAGEILLTQEQQEAGHIVSASRLNNQTFVLLVEIRLEVLAEKQLIFWNGQEISIFETQPYLIPLEP